MYQRPEAPEISAWRPSGLSPWEHAQLAVSHGEEDSTSCYTSLVLGSAGSFLTCPKIYL